MQTHEFVTCLWTPLKCSRMYSILRFSSTLQEWASAKQWIPTQFISSIWRSIKRQQASRTAIMSKRLAAARRACDTFTRGFTYVLQTVGRRKRHALPAHSLWRCRPLMCRRSSRACLSSEARLHWWQLAPVSTQSDQWKTWPRKHKSTPIIPQLINRVRCAYLWRFTWK